MDEVDKIKGIPLIDDSQGLTLEELAEIKKLVALSKTTKIVAGVIFGVIGVLGLPAILSWVSKHFN